MRYHKPVKRIDKPTRVKTEKLPPIKFAIYDIAVNKIVTEFSDYVKIAPTLQKLQLANPDRYKLIQNRE